MNTLPPAPTSELLARVLALATLCIPGLFVVGALLVPSRRPFGRALTMAGAAFLLALGVAATVHAGPLPFGVRHDALTATMLLLVTFIGLVILRFSRSYLDGEAGAARFVRGSMATLAAVTTLVTTDHLVVLALAWVATSLSLHSLLTFYPGRTGAVVAAHKKFLVSRLADLCLLGGIVLVGMEVGSLRIDDVLAWSNAATKLPLRVELAAVLLALGASLKSAQLPFHGWLIQVMEAPTPVSALLHAGVVNLGGFLMIRLAPLLARAAVAQTMLVVIGSATAVIAALVMTTRVSVKVALAWSTCAQMGFMLLQCGLGAYQLALLHLVAHSLYKAHAFLGSGSAVDVWQVQALAPTSARGSLARTAAAVVAAALVVAGVARAFDLRPSEDPALWALGAVLMLALASLAAAAPRGAAARAGLAATALAVAYFGWHALFGAVVTTPASAPVMWPRIAIVWIAFGALFALQTALRLQPHGRLARALHPWLYAGLHLDEVFTRATFRLWPPRLAAQPVSPPLLSQLGDAEV